MARNLKVIKRVLTSMLNKAYWLWQLFFPFWERYILFKLLQKYINLIIPLQGKQIVLIDLGCGKGDVEKYLWMKLSKKRHYIYSVGLDIYLPYLKMSKGVLDDVIMADIRFLPFRQHATNIILLLDVIEHLEKLEALKLLNSIEAIVKEYSIMLLITPYGFIPQDDIDNNPYQRHLSGWFPEELMLKGFIPMAGLGGDRHLKLMISQRLSKNYLLWKIIDVVLQTISNCITVKNPFKGFRLLYVKVCGKSCINDMSASNKQ